MPVVYKKDLETVEINDETGEAKVTKPRRYTEKDVFCKCSKNKIDDSMKKKLKEHSKHHSKEHMKEMKRLIKNGVSFNKAHKEVIKTIGK